MGGSGIGTLIVFISVVLVAAVGASVLLSSTGHISHVASNVGKESTSQTSGSLLIRSIEGKQIDGTIDQIIIYVTPDAGSDPIDLSRVNIELKDGESSIIYTYAGN